MDQMTVFIFAALVGALCQAEGLAENGGEAIPHTASADQGAAITRFRNEFGDALRRTEAYFAEVAAAGTLKMSATRPGADRLETVYEVSYLSSGGASKFEKQEIGKSTEEVSEGTVWCRNPNRYVFHLERRSRDEPFIQRHLAAKDSDPIPLMDWYNFRYLNASHAVFGVPLSVIVGAPGFQILTADLLEEDGLEIVHIKYEFPPPADADHRNGELWLSPAEGWAVKRFWTEYLNPDDPVLSQKGERTGTVSYSRVEDGVAIPAKVSISGKYREYGKQEEFVFKSLDHHTSSEHEFTLSIYGLPEMSPPLGISAPSGSALSNVRSRLWALLVINGLVVAAFLAWIVLRWRRNPKT